MKNVNVLLAVVLCAGLCVLFGLFNRSADESLGWSPNDMYMQSISSGEGASFTSANLSGSNVSNDGVAVSMRNGSFSLRTRASRASSPSSLVANGGPEKSVDFLGALSPNSPIASSPNAGVGLISHMTSSAEFHSFGGGSNMAMGSYASSSNSLLASSPAIGSYSPSPMAYNPIASSPNNLIAYSPSNGEVQVAAEQALMSASSSASGLFGSALQNTYGTASYSDYVGMSGGKPSGIRGRQNAGPQDSWLKWLSEHETGEWGIGTQGEDGKWTYTYTEDQLREAYDAWVASLPQGSLTPGLPSFEAWWEWMLSGQYDGYGYNGNTYRWVPVGSILPLLILALMYCAYVAIRRRESFAE